MSLKMSNLVWDLGLKANQMLVMLAIADAADDDGACFWGQVKLARKANVSESTFRRILVAMKQRDLLHTEHRPTPWGRGRRVDAIILHPRQMRAQAEDGLGPDPEDERLTQENRRLYEVDPEGDPQGDSSSPATLGQPVDNSGGDQPVKVTGWNVSPSQDQPVKVTGWSTNLHDQPVKSDDQPVKSNSEASGALIGSRARLIRSVPFKGEHQPVDNSSSTQADRIGSVRVGSEDQISQKTPESTRAGQAPESADSERSTPPAQSEAPGQGEQEYPAVLGVPLRLLRLKLGGKAGILGQVDDEVLGEIIRIVIGRVCGEVRSPVGLMIARLRKPSDASELIEEAQAIIEARHERTQNITRSPSAALAWSEVGDYPSTGSLGAERASGGLSGHPRMVTCPTHNMEYPETGVCGGCRAERIAAPQVSQTPIADSDKPFDREAWLAEVKQGVADRVAKAQQISDQTKQAVRAHTKNFRQGGAHDVPVER